MADKHSLNFDVRELKLGATFMNNKASQYHTIKYDFKPASVDVKKMATVEVGTNHQVTVTVPHLDGAGVPQTVFKGNQRPYTKECVLIIDRDTGEITLEKLSSNIQVKKTRQEAPQRARPLTPLTAPAPTDVTNTTQRSTSRTRVATNRRTTNTVNPAAVNQPPSQARFNAAGQANTQKTPPNMVRSPQRVKISPPEAAPWLGGNSTLASLPMLGLDEAMGAAAGAGPSPSAPTPSAPPVPPPVPPGPAPGLLGHPAHNGYRADRYERGPNVDRVANTLNVPSVHVTPPPQPHQTQPQSEERHDSSSSSSSDSDSGSDSGSDSDNETPTARQPIPNGNSMNPALPNDVLNDDLCLSESESESD